MRTAESRVSDFFFPLQSSSRRRHGPSRINVDTRHQGFGGSRLDARFCYRSRMFRLIRHVALILLLVSFAIARDRYQKPGPVKLDRDGEKWAEKTLKKMSLQEKVGQLFMVWARGQFLNLDSPEFAEWRDQINKYHVGGFALTVPLEDGLLRKSEPYEAAMITNQLQRDSKAPLIFAADFERGLAMRLNGPTAFPHAMAFAATGKRENAATLGRVTAEEARAVGVQWNFFPVADVNSNPANPIINTRAFGEDPAQVGDLVAAYIQAARQAGMLTTAKHFPGHGDTATDSHLGLAQVSGDRSRLAAVELPPFKQAIAAGVDAVMVALVTVPALEPDPERVAATSPAIVLRLLKQELGFQGIVVTDALDMGALTRHYQANIGRAAVDALKSGNDLLLIPADLPASYDAVVAAVRSGEVAEAQINASVLKLLKAKASVGLHKARLVDVNQVGRLVGKAENVTAGRQISDAAITLVRDNGYVLPLKFKGTAAATLPYQQSVEVRKDTLVLIFSDDTRGESGRAFVHEFRARVPDANVTYVDPRTASALASQVLADADQARQVVAAVYVVPVAGKVVEAQGTMKNSVELADATGALLAQLLQRDGAKTVVASLGNPYLAAGFPDIQNYLCSFSNVAVSEVSTVKGLFGEIPLRGRLPVSIPGIAPRGAGLDRAAKPRPGVPNVESN
jgi:beta-N-acetylhexosaminidase